MPSNCKFRTLHARQKMDKLLPNFLKNERTGVTRNLLNQNKEHSGETRDDFRAFALLNALNSTQGIVANRVTTPRRTQDVGVRSRG